MKLSRLLAFIACLFSVSSHGAVLLNSNFETGTLAGWGNGAGATVTATSLSGAYSAFIPGGAGGGSLAQNILGPTSNTLSLLFSMPDPGADADRGFNLFAKQDGVLGSQINLRVVDLGNDGDGDVQIFHSALGAWQTIAGLTDSVVFGGTNLLQMTFDGFGAGLNYRVRVNDRAVQGLTFSQDGQPTQFGRIEFSNAFGTSAFTVDNIVVPEPGRAVLLAGGFLVMALRRRKR